MGRRFSWWRGLDMAPGWVAASPLRRVDPRTKLALGLGLSLAVMLPLAKVAAALVLYLGLLAWGRLLRVAARQAWRLAPVLAVLFLVDWWVVSLELAVIVTLRLLLLSGAFALFFATTTPEELRLALEWLRVPYRYAFSVSLAFQSLGLLDEEWRTLREAQGARGIREKLSWRSLPAQVENLVGLLVPTIVMATRRAWAINEAAYARGFDSPHRRPSRRLCMGRSDWLLLAAAAAAAAALVVWPGPGA